jgi:uncharacterized protein YlzI (FlbEa/FlbD family)
MTLSFATRLAYITSSPDAPRYGCYFRSAEDHTNRAGQGRRLYFSTNEIKKIDVRGRGDISILLHNGARYPVQDSEPELIEKEVTRREVEAGHRFYTRS